MHRIAYYAVCDDCDRETDIHKTWMAFINEMAKDGWKMFTQPNINVCPDCVKNYNETSPGEIGIFADD